MEHFYHKCMYLPFSCEVVIEIYLPVDLLVCRRARINTVDPTLSAVSSLTVLHTRPRDSETQSIPFYHSWPIHQPSNHAHTHSLTSSIYPLTQSPTHSLNQSPTYSLTHSPTYSPTHQPNHSLCPFNLTILLYASVTGKIRGRKFDEHKLCFRWV